MNELQIFCQNVKFLRLKHNLSQKQMAQICKVGVKSIILIEKGIIPRRLSSGILFHIMDYFEIPPYKMFEELSES